MAPVSVDQYLQGLAPRWRPVAGALRDLVAAAAPDDVEEHIKWSMPVFSHRGANICYIDSRTATHVNLGFYQGTHLPDPEGLLEGTGKILRHVKVRSEADVSAPALAELVRAAFAHEEG